MTLQRKALGRAGEEHAAKFLQKKGYRILQRNYRNRIGEIDLICEYNSLLIFVEVRTKSSSRFGTGAESVTAQKQHRIHQVALLFLTQRKWMDRSIRFDVVDIQFTEPPRVIHLEGAF